MTSTLELVTTLRGHTGPVWCVAWSPRGILASCGVDKTVRVWHRAPRPASECDGELGDATWVCLASCSKPFLRAVRCVAWGVDGRSLAAASFDAAATVLELVGGRSPRLEGAVSLDGHESEVKSVAYSSSGGLLASCSRDRTVWIWEVGLDFDYECVAVLNGHSADVKSVVWHPSAEILVSTSYDNDVRVWAEDEDDWFCLETLSAHASTVWSAAFNPAGSHLVTVSDDGAVVVWERQAAPSHIVGEFPKFTVVSNMDAVHAGSIYSVDWSSNTDAIVTGGADDCIRVLTQKARCRDTGGDSSRGRECNGGDPAAGEEQRGRKQLRTETDEVWQVDATAVRAHSGDVNCVAWNVAEKNMLASCGDDGLVRIWTHKPGRSEPP